MSNELNINAIEGGGRPSRRRALMMMQSRGYIVNWNQVSKLNYRKLDGDGTITINEDRVDFSSTSANRLRCGHDGFSFVAGNIYYYRIKRGVSNGRLDVNFSLSNVPACRVSEVWNAAIAPSRYSTNFENHEYYAESESGGTAFLEKEKIIDLTQLFGAGNEPPTVAQFESWLQENGIDPNEYIPYNAGEQRTMIKPNWL